MGLCDLKNRHTVSRCSQLSHQECIRSAWTEQIDDQVHEGRSSRCQPGLGSPHRHGPIFALAFPIVVGASQRHYGAGCRRRHASWARDAAWAVASLWLAAGQYADGPALASSWVSCQWTVGNSRAPVGGARRAVGVERNKAVASPAGGRPRTALRCAVLARQ